MRGILLQLLQTAMPTLCTYNLELLVGETFIKYTELFWLRLSEQRCLSLVKFDLVPSATRSSMCQSVSTITVCLELSLLHLLCNISQPFNLLYLFTVV